ncbi:MAG: alkaline phosphatase family protein [Clostridia bacterium]|nr:alkaline phosphatase family protein [Clostridia bacterium]
MTRPLAIFTLIALIASIVVIGMFQDGRTATARGSEISMSSEPITPAAGSSEPVPAQDVQPEIITSDTALAEYVVYINWDAFRRDYYDWANEPGQPGTPNLNYLMSRGVYYPNATNGFPSITNPMQTSIVTGSWPATHSNAYKYYNQDSNTVDSSGRTNLAETIAEAASASGLSTASVQQFMLQDRGTSDDDPRHLYIQPGGRFELRVLEAIKMLRGEPVRNTKGQLVSMTEIPRFLAIYGDDLDAAGHNGTGYGSVPSLTYDQWAKKMTAELIRMDRALGTFIEALRELGVFEKTAILLTADHGMTPYWGKSSLPGLIQVFNGLGYKCEFLPNSGRAADDTDVVMVGSGQSVQVYFRRTITEEQLNEIIAAVSAQPYVGGLLDRKGLAAAGAHPVSGQLVVWPAPPHHFSRKDISIGLAANHDTRDASSHNVFMLVSGSGVKPGLVIDAPVEIIDAAPTMSRLLGIRPPANATGRILEEALEEPALLGAETTR